MENPEQTQNTRLRLSGRLLKRLGDRLVEDGVLTRDQLQLGLDRQQNTGEFLGEALIALGLITPTKIAPYMEEISGFPFFDFNETRVDTDVAKLLSETFCRTRLVIPFRESGGRVHVAMVDPLNLAVVDNIRATLERPIVPYVGFVGDVMEAIRRTFGGANRAYAVIEEMLEGSAPPGADLADENLMTLADEAPVVRLVTSIVQGAIGAGASDIHLEPQETDVRVRYRIDGLLYEQMAFPAHYHNAVMSRLKIISSLDIAERRRPQDGRFAVREDAGRDFDIRLSIMPTVYGEKACMRLLEKQSSMGSLDRLGLFPEQREMFERLIRRPHGIILVTGPTGSGKSTTLYAALTTINEPALNINTIEDPVEYKLAGVNQMQVNPRIGVTFATGLRTLVRQDPDVILVGEIRDAETAEIAVQAALTGHLVMSTLHTNDAPGALVRLQNMGVERFLLASAVIGVVGQRLLRTTCLGCREEEPLSRAMAMTLGLPERSEPYIVARGRGCRRCSGRGTLGRTAVYEMLTMSEPLRQSLLAGESGTELTRLAIEGGMTTMHQNAIRKMLELRVSPEEVMRVLSYES